MVAVIKAWLIGIGVTSGVVATTAALTYGLLNVGSATNEYSSDSVDPAYHANSFTDAVEPCKAELENRYGGDIISVHIDTRSSIYRHELRQYKVFLYTDIDAPALFGGSAQYQLQVICWVNASDLSVSDYRTYRKVGGEWPDDQ